MLSLSKFRAEEVPVLGMKMFTRLKSLYDAEELYLVCFNTLRQR